MSENGNLSKRDRQALNDAHDKYIKEPELMVWVLETLMKPDDPEKDERMPKFTTHTRYGAAMGHNDPRLLYGNATTLEHQHHVETQRRASSFFNKALGKF
jgi:hypothetical protein